jgi:hypothetical protein
VRVGLAGVTAFYEVLTTMAAGALVAAVLFALLLPDSASGFDLARLWGLVLGEAPEGSPLDRRLAVALAVGLLVPLLVPILPPVFNRVVGRLSLPFREPDSPPPRLPNRVLPEGLLIVGAGWLCLGASLDAALRGVVADAPAWGWAGWGRHTAYLGVAYVAGFVILVAPSGLGVREFFLTLFLVPDLAGVSGATEEQVRAEVILAVLVLRLVWTVAEVATATVAAVWWLRKKVSGPFLKGS